MCLKRIHFNPAQISVKLTKIESDFIAKGGKWKEFRIGDLFEVRSSKKIFHANQIKQIYEDEQKDTFPYVVRSTLNNGIRGYINENKDFLNPSNTLSFAQDTFSVFYQDKPYFTGNKVKVLFPKFKNFNKTKALFIVAIYHKALAHLTWGIGSTTESIQEINIKLPTQDDKIAFDFMESFIKELELEQVAEMEAERIKELEAYLQATGLNNYELTDNEKQTLDIFTNSNSTQSLEWQEFRIGDLFSVKSNPQLNKDSFTFRENGQYPYFTRTVLNNGIAGYVDYLDEKHKIKGGGLAVGMLGMQFFYMEKDFYAGQFTKTCYPKFENFNKQIAYFFIAWLNKNQKVFQGVLVRDFEKVFNNTKIKLPTNKNGQIDFDFMESFISAVQKEVIKSVNLWKQKRINVTKEVINLH